MKIKYTRTYECEVPDTEILAALQERVDEWEYEDGERKQMGVNDILYRLDAKGLLQDTDQVELPEIDPYCFGQDFYTVEEMTAELAEE